jgi:hypothetical protein
MNLMRQSVGLLGWAISPVARPLPTQNKRGQTSMPREAFELAIPVSEKADRAATVIGSYVYISGP